jgi:hypothetical protein
MGMRLRADLILLILASGCGSRDAQPDAGQPDAGCRRDLDCTCPTPLCDFDTGVCREWGADAGGVSRARDEPGGTSCSAPRLLPLWQPNDTLSIAGVFGSRQPTPPPTDDERGTCSPGAAAESIYLLRLCESRTIQVSVRNDQISGGASLAYLRSGVCQGPELICVGPKTAGLSAGFTLGLTAGDYFLFVDNAQQGSFGTITLR